MFTPYRGSDVEGHVRIHGIWMTAWRVREDSPEVPAGTILITRLGWGDTAAGTLCDFTPAEQALLMTTLDEGLQTTDGCPIVTMAAVRREAIGRETGRIGIYCRGEWVWYWGFATDARRQEVVAKAQTMTAMDFDVWFDTAP